MPEKVLAAVPVQYKRSEFIMFSWLKWHFVAMPLFLLSVWKNYILFGLDFFSVPLLASTLFAPWRRYRWSYSKHFNPVAYLGTFISNLFSRIVGAICRVVLIVAGIALQIAILLV